jgi:hypothetical protein
MKKRVYDLFYPQNIGLESKKEDDAATQKHFDLNVTKRDGRYEVSLPFKVDDLPELGADYGMALKRFQALLLKLRQNPELLARYHQAKLDLLADGIIEEVRDRFQQDGPVHYLPHSVVLRADKPDKIRIVYDGSASSNGGLSLNECLYRGPVLLPHIAGVLLRTRLQPGLLTCDI